MVVLCDDMESPLHLLLSSVNVDFLSRPRFRTVVDNGRSSLMELDRELDLDESFDSMHFSTEVSVDILGDIKGVTGGVDTCKESRCCGTFCCGKKVRYCSLSKL